MRKANLILVIFAAVAFVYGQDSQLPLKKDSLKFAVIGDNGTGDRREYQVAEKLNAAHAKFPFQFILMMGDNFYGGEAPKDFEKKFEKPYKPLLDAGVKFYASLGNHDNPNERFYKLFNMNEATYYTFKKGNVRFYVLDSNYMDAKQLEWLQKQLQDAGEGDWKICYFHHPLYSSGKSHGSSIELRSLIEPLFVKYGVDAVFSGHDHIYERVKPEKGIYYFVEGSSGQLRAGGLAKSNITDDGFDSDRTFMMIEITGDEMYFQTLSRAGNQVDSGVFRRPVRTPAPTK